ncbi:hypothetical protein ACIA6E_20290 [Streptomyces sp. NPDC051815]|uniref:hypothetical protein n=1 Tax=Streptomyces sp. NPDC051815 TaxID=3365674 RepID=UPI0037B4CA05
MLESQDQHDGESDTAVAALLRAADEAAVRALRNRLDIEGRLAEVVVRGDGERASARCTVSWSLELCTSTVRATGTARRTVRSVEDAAFFSAVVGRPREGLEPWPEVVLGFDAEGPELTAMLALPSPPPDGVCVTAVVRWEGGAVEARFTQVEDSVAGGLGPVALTARLRSAPVTTGVGGDLVLDVRVVGHDEHR